MPSTTQITIDELKKMLDESALSAELKTAYGQVMEQMDEDEKKELQRILDEERHAKAEYEESRFEHLARLNKALEKHLQDSLHDEEKYAREQFEELEHKEDEAEMKTLEQEINQL